MCRSLTSIIFDFNQSWNILFIRCHLRWLLDIVLPYFPGLTEFQVEPAFKWTYSQLEAKWKPEVVWQEHGESVLQWVQLFQEELDNLDHDGFLKRLLVASGG